MGCSSADKMLVSEGLLLRHANQACLLHALVTRGASSKRWHLHYCAMDYVSTHQHIIPMQDDCAHKDSRRGCRRCLDARSLTRIGVAGADDQLLDKLLTMSAPSSVPVGAFSTIWMRKRPRIFCRVRWKRVVRMQLAHMLGFAVTLSERVAVAPICKCCYAVVYESSGSLTVGRGISLSEHRNCLGSQDACLYPIFPVSNNSAAPVV